MTLGFDLSSIQKKTIVKPILKLVSVTVILKMYH